MTKEVIREMYQLLLTEPHAPTVCAKLERIARDALARPEHEPEEDDEDPICSWCNGCGEGMYDGSTCYKCKGTGVEPVEKDEDL